MRRAVATIPGVERQLRPADQPPHRPHDLGQQDEPGGQGLRARPRGAARPRRRRRRPSCASVPGIVDLSNQEQATRAAAPDRLRPRGHGAPRPVSRRVWRAPSRRCSRGREAGEIVEGGLDLAGRRPLPGAAARRTASGSRRCPSRRPRATSSAWARCRACGSTSGPGLVRRENVQRVAMLTANVAGADLAGTVEQRAARRSTSAVNLPAGLPGRLRRPVRGGERAACGTWRVAGRARPGGDVRPALRRLPQPPPRADRPRQPAAGADRRRLRGRARRRRAERRVARRVHHALRHRDPQRRAARQPLPAPDAARRGCRSRRRCAAARASGWRRCS